MATPVPAPVACPGGQIIQGWFATRLIIGISVPPTTEDDSFQDGTSTADGSPSDPTPGGQKGPFSDVYFYSHLQVDAQGSVRLKHGLTFTMYGLNLTNEVFGFYQGSSQFMIQREYYGQTIAAGFRWSPSFEK